MPLTINTNMAASRASYFLSKNNDALQKSLDRLSSGKRITQPSDDAGGLAVSMKMQGTIDNLNGAANNVSNALSFLQVQDGILDSVAQIVGRMGELKALTQDVLKSTDDINTYNSEFQSLQGQLYSLSQTKFNGVTLFTNVATTDGDPANAATGFERESTAGSGTFDLINKPVDTNIVGAGGTEITISKSLLLNALTFNVTYSASNIISSVVSDTTWSDTAQVAVSDDGAGGFTNGLLNLAVQDTATANKLTTLTNVGTEIFTKALEQVATMRATNGGEAKRLQFEQQNIATQATNMTAALGRIMDVDIAAETTNLAKQQILVQASASMVAQANSANQVALMLLQ
jgi:flagellin